MGKFDDATDEELENERRARIRRAKAKRSGNRDEVLILRGRHASRYLAGDRNDEPDDEGDEGEEEEEEEGEDNDEGKPAAPVKKAAKKAAASTKKVGSGFKYFKD